MSAFLSFEPSTRPNKLYIDPQDPKNPRISFKDFLNNKNNVFSPSESEKFIKNSKCLSSLLYIFGFRKSVFLRNQYVLVDDFYFKACYRLNPNVSRDSYIEIFKHNLITQLKSFKNVDNFEVLTTLPNTFSNSNYTRVDDYNTTFDKFILPSEHFLKCFRYTNEIDVQMMLVCLCSNRVQATLHYDILRITKFPLDEYFVVFKDFIGYLSVNQRHVDSQYLCLRKHVFGYYKQKLLSLQDLFRTSLITDTDKSRNLKRTLYEQKVNIYNIRLSDVWIALDNLPIIDYPDKGLNSSYSSEPSLLDDACSDFLFNLFFWTGIYVTGGMFFILSGGESNPGPVLSRLLDTAGRKTFDFIKWCMRQCVPYQVGDFMNDLVKSSVWASHFLRLFTSVTDFLKLTFSFGGFSYVSNYDLAARVNSLILNLYETMKKFYSTDLIIADRVQPQAGGLETVLVSSLLSTASPMFIKQLLLDLPKYTNTKGLDACMPWIVDTIVFVLSIPRKLFKMFSISSTDEGKAILGMMMTIENMFPFSHMGRTKKMMLDILDSVNKEPGLFLKEGFQVKFNSVNKTRKEMETDYLRYHKNLPDFYVNASKEFDDLAKRIYSYSNNTRVEPVCIIHVGPPGAGKTVMNTNILTMYTEAGHRVYTDNIPSTVDSRNFFDQYNDEFIYTTDDIGAKGKAQFAHLVNMVSSQKCMLDAAEVKYKDTKFFNSKLMLLTSNSIPDSFSPSDGVADKEALYRRFIVFDYSDVKFDGKHHGDIKIKKYNDTQGVKRFITQDTINTDNIDEALADVDAFIRVQLQKKIDNYLHNTDRAKQYKSEKLPEIKLQAGSSIYDYFCCDYGFDGIKYFYEQSVVGLSDIQSIITDLSLDTFKELNWINLAIGIGTVVMFSGAVYYAIKSLTEKEELVEDEQSIPNHYYTSSRFSKSSLNKVITQGRLDKNGNLSGIAPPQLSRYCNNTMKMTFLYENMDGKTVKGYCRGLLSMDKILTIAHVLITPNLSKDIFVTIEFQDQRIYDHMSVKILEYNVLGDWCIFVLPSNAPKFTKKINIPDKALSPSLFLCIGDGDMVDLDEDIARYGTTSEYDINGVTTHLTENDITYSFEGDRMCGSPLLTKDGYLYGLHVAKVTNEDKGDFGISRVFSTEDLTKIRNIFSTSIGKIIPIKITGESISGVEVEGNFHSFSPSETKYVKSKAHGYFPETRKPALLLKGEKRDTDILSLKMLEKPGDVQLKPLDTAIDSLDDLLDKESSPLSMHELISGGDTLNRIDPKTSCGSDYPGPKSDYIDYENSTLTCKGYNAVQNFCEDIVSDNYDYSDTATVTLKDELKNVIDPSDPDSLPKKVRIFTNYHIVATLILRFFLGDLMAFVSKNRLRNGIMVGLNPLSKEWEKFHDHMTKFGRQLFDGDYSNYDNYMHPAFQRKLNKLLKRKCIFDKDKFNNTFKTNYSTESIEKIFDQCLECIITTPITSRNRKILTTHGLPSGTAVTCFYNSCINKLYLAYAYFNIFPESSISNLRMSIRDAVFGDDVLVGVKPEIREFFNPKNYAKIMATLGLGFTPADKGEWTQDNMSRDITLCTFLKRGFYFHPLLNQIVGPLDISSMEGTLNYVSDRFRNEELTEVKVHNYQREAFLHGPSYYNYHMAHLQTFLESKNIYIQLLSEKFLCNLYNKNEYSELLSLK